MVKTPAIMVVTTTICLHNLHYHLDLRLVVIEQMISRDLLVAAAVAVSWAGYLVKHRTSNTEILHHLFLLDSSSIRLRAMDMDPLPHNNTAVTLLRKGDTIHHNKVITRHSSKATIHSKDINNKLHRSLVGAWVVWVAPL